jgi:arabinosaccharide transport system substrate-binding protein
MLVYRADLVEAAGIDVSRIETWDDYFRMMRPLTSGANGDGYIDRYPLALSLNNPFFSEIFVLQGGGGYFDPTGAPTLNSPVNARLIARLAIWYGGPDRVIGNFDMFSGAGLQLISGGHTLAILAPDWYAGSLVTALPHLAGKLKVMPLPAWERGGRRTSVNGGTMLGITKASRHQKEAWELAKYLYFSPVMAERLFANTHIVSPIKSNWLLPCYDRPDPYFSNQPVGRLYLQQAPQVPLRPSSPYIATAILMMNNALTQLIRVAELRHCTAPGQILPEAGQVLDEVQRSLAAQMHRNVFLNRPPL